MSGSSVFMMTGSGAVGNWDAGGVVGAGASFSPEEMARSHTLSIPNTF